MNKKLTALKAKEEKLQLEKEELLDKLEDSELYRGIAESE